MVDDSLLEALRLLIAEGEILRNRFHFDWDRQTQETVQALRYLLAAEDRRNGGSFSIVALIGGASSGKSTVFNNLLGGAHASRVTAKGHSTLGPIAAVHESRRDSVEAAFETGLLLPSFETHTTTLNDGVAGTPGHLHVAYHDIDALRDVLLLDMPDFTSEPARQEGDIALATLPWFDRLVVLIDAERWFDRQTIGQLREASAQFGQERFVVFNRSRDGVLADHEKAKLQQQADRLHARGEMILEFRHGRGCPVFPPGELDPVFAFLQAAPPTRKDRLLQRLGRRAEQVLSNNAERHRRLLPLHQALDKAVSGSLPSNAECLTAFLSPDERRHLDVLTRTLRIRETRDWLSRQAGRIRTTLRKHVPVLGTFFGTRPDQAPDTELKDVTDRHVIGWEVFRSRCTRQLSAIEEATTRSDFWKEVRRWTGKDPGKPDVDSIDQHREVVSKLVSRIDEAIGAWSSKVESECKTAYPQLFGAVGGTTVAAAIVLIAVTGPVSALTLPAALSALSGAFGSILAAAGAGTLAGGPMRRMLAVVQERLIGSEEFAAVRDAIETYREAIAAVGQTAAEDAIAEAESLVLPEQEKLGKALSAVCDAAEVD